MLKPPTSNLKFPNSASGGIQYNQASGQFEAEQSSQLNYSTGQFEESAPGQTQLPSVYSDLPGPLIHLKNQIAEQKKRRKNIEFYFADDRLKNSAEEEYQLENKEREELSAVERMEQVVNDQGGIELSDPETFVSGFADLERMIDQLPKPPERSAPEQPSDMALLVSGGLSFFGGSKALGMLVMPFGYEIAKAQQRDADNQNLYAHQIQQWELKYGLTQERARALATAMQNQEKIRSERAQKIMEMAWEASKIDQGQRHELNKLIASAEVDIRKLGITQQNDIAKAIFARAIDPTAGQAMRGYATMLFSALTGMDLPAFEGLTPQEQSMTIEDALKVMQGKRLGQQISQDEELFPAKLRKEYASAAYEELRANHQGQINHFFPQEKSLEIASGYAALEISAANLAKINREGGGGVSESEQRELRSSIQTKIGELGYQFDSAIDEKRGTVQSIKAELAGIEERAKTDLKKEGKWKEPGGFAWGKVSKEQADKENKQQLDALLNQNKVYQAKKQALNAETEQLEKIQARRNALKGLQIGTEDQAKVNQYSEEVKSYQSPQAVITELSGAIGAGKLTASEASKVLLAVPETVLPHETKLKIMKSWLVTAAEQAGFTQPIEYADAAISQFAPVGVFDQDAGAKVNEWLSGSVDSQKKNELNSGYSLGRVGATSGIVPGYFQKTSRSTTPPKDMEGVARYLAVAAQGKGLPPELPIMVGLVESGLRNLPHLGSKNDFDSIGMFQQRGNWGSVSERSDVAKSAEKFLRAAAQKMNTKTVYWQTGGRLANGGKKTTIQLKDTLGNLINAARERGDQAEYKKLVGYLAQEIQRSAFGERYVNRFDEAVKLLGGQI